MLDNNTYNLMMQLTEEHKSLWRIKKHYLKDAGTNKASKEFWNKLAKEKELHIKELGLLIQKSMR
jgi:hypothetical protein